jgi:hypothetical protein
VATRTLANPETKFNREAWLMLIIAIALQVYSIVNFAYQFTLPGDGWEVNEGYNPPGLVYSKNLMGNPSLLQPGDFVTAVEGIPADSKVISQSPSLKGSWQAGATIDYSVIRDGQEIHVPVTLVNWRFGKWLLANLRDPVKLSGLLSGIILLALAVFVFYRRPGSPSAGAFLVIMVMIAGSILGGTLPTGFTSMVDPLANVLQNIFNWYLLLALFPFAIIRFALVFPHPKPIHQRYSWLSYLAGAIGLILTLLPLDLPVGIFWLVFSLFITVAILIHNAFTMRDSVSQAQLRWGLGGLIIGFCILAFMFLAGSSGWIESHPEILDLMFSVATTVMGSMLAVAILRYRLFDIDLIINRTLVYGGLTLTLALIYFTSILLLQTLFQIATGESQSPLVIVISTLAIAALFTPLRRRIQNEIDRRFYRRKYDSQKMLEVFASNLRQEVDLDEIGQSLVAVAVETMQPENVTLWLPDSFEFRQRASWREAAISRRGKL